MVPQNDAVRHDTARAAGLIGNGISPQVIRRWARARRFDGFQQQGANSKLWLTDRGVLEVWALWAEHTGLDSEMDMPPGVRKLIDKGTSPVATTPDSPGLSVTIILPPGAHLQVIQQ